MHLDWPLDESTLAHARASIVQASRAAGIEPPLDTVWIHVKDLENLEKSTRLAKQMGFQGKLCIHPPQVEVVNRIFTPNEAAVRSEKRRVGNGGVSPFRSRWAPSQLK